MLEEKLFEITFKRNIPFYVVFELTYRCNLNCRHCYIVRGDGKRELSTKHVKHILNELAKNQVLSLVFTGGEVFLREDFLDLCKYARDLFFNLIIFTNATLLDEKKVSFLKEISVSCVDVSLYGRKSVHDYITRCDGSFNRTLRAIELLLEYKIKTYIKCPLMNINFSEYKYLMSLAKEMGIGFKFDITVTPKIDGSKEPLKYRLNENQMSSILKEYIHGEYPNNINKHDLLFCSAGRNFATIDPYGNLYPCLQLPYNFGNLLSGEFRDTWFSEKVRRFREIAENQIKPCYNCNLLSYCRRCPGLALVEDGDLFGQSRIACKLAKIYKKLIEDEKEKEEIYKA